MNRRDFLKMIRDAAIVAPSLTLVGNLPEVKSSAIVVPDAEEKLTWEWTAASESSRRIGSVIYTQGTAEMWNPVTQEFYIP